MKKSIKGAIAAGTAGVLLLGGLGSLAYWSDSAAVDGGVLNSGSISLGAVTCTEWLHSETNLPVTTIVPGDNVYNDCATQLVLVGDHIGATITVDPASLPAGVLADELVATVDLQDDVGAPIAAVTQAGTTEVTAHIVVSFDGPGGTNPSQSGTAVLDDLTLAATQTHETA